MLTSCIALTLALGAAACKKSPDEAAKEKAKQAMEETKEAAEEKAEANEETREAQQANREAVEHGAAATVSTGIEECDELITKYMTCDKISVQSREAFLQGAHQWKRALETGGEAARTAVADSCKAASGTSKQALESAGC